MRYYVGVDVGTSSVRAALVTAEGDIAATTTHAIEIFESEPGFYEQSAENIWEACCNVIKSVTKDVKKDEVVGLGFDATCSLVVLDKKYQPLSVNQSGENRWNVVMWMDHRAEEQAERVNATGHDVLRNVGGFISLEMEIPKLLWLKEKLKRECWDKAGHFLELPDFLSWKATDSLSRSLNCLVCKWTYQADESGNNGWNRSFLEQVGLKDLMEENFEKVGQDVNIAGEPCGSGLTAKAAAELGLCQRTPVATSIIDAHAGVLGCLGCKPKISSLEVPLESRMAVICGTSTCHMMLNRNSLFVPGVWGPYYSSVMPGFYTHEGGQSATGKLVDHIIESHPGYSWIKEEAKSRNLHAHLVLNEILSFIQKRENANNVAELTRKLHIWPDYHGNRSPLADPSLTGM